MKTEIKGRGVSIRPLTDFEQKIVTALNEHPEGATMHAIATSVDPRSITGYAVSVTIGRLKSNGIVKADYTKKPAIYSLIK